MSSSFDFGSRHSETPPLPPFSSSNIYSPDHSARQWLVSSADPGPSFRQKRQELAQYSSFLKDLDGRHRQRSLAERLLTRHQAKSGQPGQYAVADDDRLDEDLTHIHDDEGRDERWPLEPRKLSGASISFEEAIRDFAAAYIRQHRLLPRIEGEDGKSRGQPAARLGNSHTIETLREDSAEEPNEIPESLVKSATQFTNTLLVGLAGCRRKATKKKRAAMEGMDWNTVLGVASVMRGQDGSSRAANERLRGIFTTPAEEADLISLRLDVISKRRQERQRHLVGALYAPAIADVPPELKPKRRHQSAKDRATRDEKRRIKADKRAEKAAQRAAKSRKTSQAVWDPKGCLRPGT